MKFSRQGSNDKHQYYQISVGIPLWIFSLYDGTKYFFRKWNYKLFPDKCSCCGKPKLDLSGSYEHRFENGKRLIVENHSFKNGKYQRVCRDCLLSHLQDGEWTPRFTSMYQDTPPYKRYNYKFWSTKQCAVTGEAVRSYKDVEISPWVDMTFCTIAWNHDHVSKEAVIECVQKGKQHYNRWGIYKGRMMQMNHRGIYIEGDKVV